MSATHVKVNNGVFRREPVSGIFELAAPWKQSRTRSFVRVKPNADLLGIYPQAGATCQIMCERADIEYCDAAGTPAEVKSTEVPPSNSDAREWEHRYRDIETEAEAMDRIRRSFAVLTEVTKACMRGDLRSAIVTGAPGIGKSYDVEKTLEDGTLGGDLDLNDQYSVIKGTITPLMLFQILYHHRHEGCVLVFDDCDKVFENDVSANLLKGALDTGKKRTIQWLSSGTELEAAGVDEKFDFEGAIVFLTNVDFNDIKDTKIGIHLKALKSRCLVLDLEVSSQVDMLRRIRQIMNDGLLRSFNFAVEQEQEIYAFVKKNVNELQELSLRTVLKIAGLRSAFPEQWKELSCQTVMKREAYFRHLFEQKQKETEDA